jgi:hypothetical protein
MEKGAKKGRKRRKRGEQKKVIGLCYIQGTPLVCTPLFFLSTLYVTNLTLEGCCPPPPPPAGETKVQQNRERPKRKKYKKIG